MKRFLLTATLVTALGALCLPSALPADPGGPNLQQPVSLTCTGDLGGGLMVVATGFLTPR